MGPVADGVALLRFSDLVEHLVVTAVGVDVAASAVASLRRFGERFDHGRLIAFALLNVEGETLPQVAAFGTALILGPSHRLPIRAETAIKIIFTVKNGCKQLSIYLLEVHDSG